MGLVDFPARLLAVRRAGRLLRDGRRHVVAMDPEGAEPVLREALEQARVSRSRATQAAVGEELYQVLLRRRRLDEAVPVLAELVACHAARDGPDANSTAGWRNELVRLLGRQGRFAEAEPHCRHRLDAARRRRPGDARRLGFALATLAWCERSQGRRDEAERLCREAVEVLDAGPAPRGAAGWALVGLAAVLLRRMALEDAEAESGAGDGAAVDCAGPVFEGEPLPDWALPGLAVPARAC